MLKILANRWEYKKVSVINFNDIYCKVKKKMRDANPAKQYPKKYFGKRK